MLISNANVYVGLHAYATNLHFVLRWGQGWAMGGAMISNSGPAYSTVKKCAEEFQGVV